MKKISIKFVSALAILIVLLSTMINNIYANSLNIALSADKNKLKVGDTVNVKVSWSEPMQAADYILKYDSSKLKYIKSSVDATYIKTSNQNEIGVSWFSMDDQELKEMTFEFEVIGLGDTQMSVTVDGGFADKNVSEPESYDISSNGTLNLKIEEPTNNMIIYLLIACVVLVVFAIIIEKKHKKI